jgi:hypothetical protein
MSPVSKARRTELTEDDRRIVERIREDLTPEVTEVRGIEVKGPDVEKILREQPHEAGDVDRNHALALGAVWFDARQLLEVIDRLTGSGG